MPLSDFARRHLDGALNHEGAAKEIADAIDSGGGGGVTLPVTVAQDDFNNTKLIGTDMPDLVGDLENGTGYDNVAIGLESYDTFGNFDANPYVPDPTHYALAAVTEGSANTAVGPSALMSLTLGANNTAIGNLAGYQLTTGRTNVIIGYGAGAGAITGSANVLIGSSTGGQLTSGSSNFCLGTGSGNGLTSGAQNVCIGTNAGLTNATGNNNVCIGDAADVATSSTSAAVAIGVAAVAAAGQCVLGTHSAGAGPKVIGFGGDSAPADGDIQNGQGFLYWDFSASGVVLKYKGKAADGTVISKTVTVS